MERCIFIIFIISKDQLGFFDEIKESLCLAVASGLELTADTQVAMHFQTRRRDEGKGHRVADSGEVIVARRDRQAVVLIVS